MKKNRITESEWKIMEAVWEHQLIPSRDIIKKVKESEPEWNDKTIRTYINRLVDKGFLGTKKEKLLMYYPLIAETEAVKKETDNFLKKVFRGSKISLLSNFIKYDSLTDDEIDMLKKMIKEKEDKNDI